MENKNYGIPEKPATQAIADATSTSAWARGQLVRSIAGRDKGNYYLVYAVAGERLFLVDGAARGCQNPKKKNHKHLQKTRWIAADLLGQADAKDPRNEEIRAMIKSLLQRQDHKEGE